MTTKVKVTASLSNEDGSIGQASMVMDFIMGVPSPDLQRHADGFIQVIQKFFAETPDPGLANPAPKAHSDQGRDQDCIFSMPVGEA